MEQALVPIPGDALVVVDVDRTAHDLEMIDRWVMGDDVTADLLSPGPDMDVLSVPATGPCSVRAH